MKKLLNVIGSLFVYRSPTNSREAMRKNLMGLSSKELARITGISVSGITLKLVGSTT